MVPVLLLGLGVVTGPPPQGSKVPTRSHDPQREGSLGPRQPALGGQAGSQEAASVQKKKKKNSIENGKGSSTLHPLLHSAMYVYVGCLAS